MPYVENIKVGSGKTWPVRDKEAHNLIKAIWSVVYPVGSIYMSANNVNPGVLFGGSWEQIQDKFLLAAGSTYSAGTTGGHATHTLSIDEIPSHSHQVQQDGTGYKVVWTGHADLTGGSSEDYYIASGYGLNTVNVGGGKEHNNMPPYLTVYMWKRTA